MGIPIKKAGQKSALGVDNIKITSENLEEELYSGLVNTKIEADIIDRDNRDMTREISPLKQAVDATLIDSSYMNIDEVVEAILNLVK